MLRVLRAVLVVVLLLAMAGAAALWWEYRRFTGTAYGGPDGLGGARDIDVPAGATLSQVSRSLENARVVSDGARFFLFARLQHAERKLKRGEYAFTGPLTPAQVLDMLVQGKVKTYRVTVPEGLRVDEIAPLFARAGVADEARFLAAAHDRSLLHRLGIEGPSAEGFLFPDTYVEPKGRPESAIVEEMIEHFRAAYAQAQADPAIHLTELQAATLASIVEKETGAPEERPHLACVFHNRLRIGMRLMTDPTVIYAHILATGSFDGNITKAMLLAPHPYNTYTVAGLPPGPIANAGQASLNAALHPSACDDLYFVARGDGHSVFCRDYACHNANVERYQVAPFRRAQR